MQLIEDNVITGIVTATNTRLCSFILDETVINMPHLMLHKKRRSLPQVGQTVRICGHYHHSEELHKHVFLCGKSTLICNDSSDDSSRIDYSLPSIIENQNLGIIDLEKAYVNNKAIEEFIVGLRGATAEDVAISFLNVSQDLIVHKGREQIDSCSESMLPTKVLLRTISDCRFINKTNEKYTRFPYWTFGVHGMQSTNDILLGYFYLSRHTGIPFFKDTKHRMPCCVLTKTSHDLLKLSNRLILIKKCKVFTEVFSKTGIAPLEYLMFSVDEAVVLNCLPEIESKFLVERPNGMEFKYNFKFILLKKGSVFWSSKNLPECWLKILIIHNSGNRQEFLALNSTYTEIVAFFQVDETYEIFHDKELAPYFSKEIQRLESRACRLLSEKSAVFLSSALTEEEHLSLLTIDDSSNSILSVDEAQELMKTSSEMSFQGVILAKEFVDPIESRTATNAAPVGFGTLGSKTHRVLFLSRANTKLTLYLNNWERLRLPLGLIPDMRVLVRNVIPQKGAYLKSTVLSTFTVLGYEPKVEFHSMNLFLAADHSGEALVKTESFSVLKSVLDLKRRQWRKFLEAIKILGSFDFGGGCNSKPLAEDESFFNDLEQK